MNMNNAKKILALLDRIGNEIDLLAKNISDQKPQPIPVPVKEKGRWH